MPKWRAVIFDLDDTLYPERSFVFSGFRAVADWVGKKLGFSRSAVEAELIDLYHSGVRGNTFNQWLMKHGLPVDEFVLQMVEVYRRHTPSLKLFPDAELVLQSLRGRYLLGLLSDGYFHVQRQKFEALGISDFFDEVLFTDELGRDYWKPSIRPFEEILRKLGIKEPGTAMYVADNPIKDFLGARKVGMFTVRIIRQDGEYAHLTPPTPQHAPDWIIYSLLEL